MMICVVAFIYGYLWTGLMYNDELCCGNLFEIYVNILVKFMSVEFIKYVRLFSGSKPSVYEHCPALETFRTENSSKVRLIQLALRQYRYVWVGI